MVQAEDYLHGLITMVNELVSHTICASFHHSRNRIFPKSRWAVNAVTLGDFERPIVISIFVKNLFAGFAMVSSETCLLIRRIDEHIGTAQLEERRASPPIR